MQSNLVFLALLLMFIKPVQANSSFETIGKVYEISEESMLDFIERKLREKQANGEIEKMQKEFTERAMNSINNPKGISLPKVEKDAVRFYDPTITLHNDIKDQNGRIIYPSGTKVNPLLIKGLSKRVIFIDGNSEEQVQFALKLFNSSGSQDKIILTSGSFIELMKKHKVRFYFDQVYSAGNTGQRNTMVKQFGIKRLPSIVYQESPDSHYLTIKEVAL